MKCGKLLNREQGVILIKALLFRESIVDRNLCATLMLPLTGKQVVGFNFWIGPVFCPNIVLSASAVCITVEQQCTFGTY